MKINRDYRVCKKQLNLDRSRYRQEQESGLIVAFCIAMGIILVLLAVILQAI